MSLSSRAIYRCSISHSICSLIIFRVGRNICFNISTNSVCNCALDKRLRIFIIFTTASLKTNSFRFTFANDIFLHLTWTRSILNWTISSCSCSLLLWSIVNCNRPIKFNRPRFWGFPFFIKRNSWLGQNKVESVKSFGLRLSQSLTITWYFNLGVATKDYNKKNRQWDKICFLRTQ